MSDATPGGPSGGDGRSIPTVHERRELERQPRRLPLVVLGLVAAVALGWLGLDAFQGSVVYYLTPTEALEEPPEGVFRLAGLVTDGSITRDDDTDELRFAVTDGASTVQVRFAGPVPDALTDGAEAVAEGRFDPGGVFVADSVLTRCASRFEAELDVP